MVNHVSEERCEGCTHKGVYLCTKGSKCTRRIIYAGLGGGFGGADKVDVLEFENIEDAERYAWERACQEYESYAGLHGLRDIEQIMEEEDCDEEIAQEYYNEERKGWIDYYVI